jgi:hypothetical protein
MPKTKISEYSATNSANTDIEGINIDEGCAPSGINNAIRELMVHLKEFQTGASGDAFTFAGGTLMSGTNTISGAAIISGNINSSGTNTFSGSNFMSFSGGSSASPSIYFASDTNTGIFSPAADTIAFTEGGVESMRIDSGSRLLVGLTSGSGANLLQIQGESGSSAGIGGIALRRGLAPSLLGSGSTLGRIDFGANDGGVGASIVAQGDADQGTNDYPSRLEFYTTPNASATPAERMRIDSSGNVLVGTTTSSGANITVYGSSEARTIYQNSTSGTGTGNGFYVGTSGADALLYHYENGPLLFATNNTERARIDSSGNLLVGVTSQLYGERLNVTRGGAGNNAATFYFDTSDDRAAIIVRHAGASGATSRKQLSFLDSAGTERGSISSTGSATAYTTSSDYRLKHDIAPMQNALATVAQLKPVTYKWKSDGSDGEGFIAHELAEVAPQCVHGEKDAVDEDGTPAYQGIDTSFLVATLTAAIQEQQAIITTLTDRITALETPTGTQA